MIGNLIAGMDAVQRKDTRQRLLDGLIVKDTSMAAIRMISSVLSRSPQNQAARVSGSGTGGASSSDSIELFAFANQVMEQLPKATRAAQLEALTHLARTSVANQAPTEELARNLFELLKYPSPRATETADAIRTLFTSQGAPGSEAGRWALVTWAKRRYPSIDLDSPAQ
jgi:hypothetical protein